ncbi:MAG: hypothetical protein PHC61_13750 [Chitinivibrionales bacterium]|nr:hypothetical protein [Chitinivibrionales bacterium]
MSFKKLFALGLVMVPMVSLMAQPAAVRSPVYNTIMQSGIMQGNVAADLTTSDYMLIPHLIGDNQFVAGYGLDVNNNACLTFKSIGFNWLGDIDNNADRLRVKAGLAVSNVFGAGLLYNLNKHGLSDESASNADPVTKGNTSLTAAGDGIGLFGSFNLGFAHLYGDLSYYFASPADSSYHSENTSTPAGGASTTVTADSTHTRFNINVGLLKPGSGQGSMAFGALLNVFDASASDGDAKTIKDNTFGIGISGSCGTPISQSEDFAVFLGGKVGIMTAFYTNGLDTPNVALASVKSSTTFDFYIRPNVSFQKQLGHGFETQLGASANLLDMLLVNSKTHASAKTGSSDVTSNNATVALGLRWKKDNFAIDGELSKTMLASGPYLISGNTGVGNLFGSLGVSLGF